MSRSRFMCWVAVCLLLGCFPIVADAALAKASGGSGNSGTLSSNPTIRQQQLICDPDEPLMGSTTVEYNSSIMSLRLTQNSTLTYAQGYQQPEVLNSQKGFVLVQTGSGPRMQPLDEFLSAGSSFPELGKVQILFQRSLAPLQQMDPAGPGGQFVTVDEQPAGTTDADTHALIFQALNPSIPLNTILHYRVYDETQTYQITSQGILDGTFTQPDYLLALDQTTINASAIAEAQVNGSFLAIAPEPSSLALAGMCIGGILLRRRRH